MVMVVVGAEVAAAEGYVALDTGFLLQGSVEGTRGGSRTPPSELAMYVVLLRLRRAQRRTFLEDPE